MFYKSGRSTSQSVSEMNSPKLNERCSSSLSNGKKHLSYELKDDSLDNSLRESLKSSKAEDDWRRRTIIIEKKNGSYGFSLQSYGIHYKKEKEIDLITYVDHVDEDGPAAAAGMREGDVILSINGTDVEKAEHSTIVQAINSCDARMRMVVIFEDCVRKVELHLKYISIQQTLQKKIREVEQLHNRERQILDTNWKTHSLPSQKKKSSSVDAVSDSDDGLDENLSKTFGRPTLSSENVAGKQSEQNLYLYRYLGPRYGTCVIQPSLQKGSFVITVGSPRDRTDCQHYVLKGQVDYIRTSDTYSNNAKHKSQKSTKTHRNSHNHSCTPCMARNNNPDANSLEAYDLASPCCDPHCVPNARKKIRRRKDCSKESRRREKSNQVDMSTQKHEYYSQSRGNKNCERRQCSERYRYLNTESTQTSQCSLQSYAGSNATAQCDNSASSYSTSLSSDTLFWDRDRSGNKSSPKLMCPSSKQQVKPKSWDNLATKAIGGYGFGYGYLDTGSKQSHRSKSHNRNHSSRSTQSYHDQHYSIHENNVPKSPQVRTYSRSQSEYAPTKSTESLIIIPKCHLDSCRSETRLTCDCPETYEHYRRPAIKNRTKPKSAGYYAQHFIYPDSPHTSKNKDGNVSSEITRL